MKHPIRILTALLLVFAAAGAAHATTLDVLLNGGSITAGDKRFDRWSLTGYTASDALRSFNAANIDVQPLNDGGLDPGPGLKFTVSNNELTVTGDGIYAFVDVMFGFRATVLDPALLIKDNSLAYSSLGASLTWAGDGSYNLGSYIRENIDSAKILTDPSEVGDLGTKDIQFSEADWAGGAITKISDSAAFAPHREVWVTKNILVWSVDDTDTASLWGFEQRFSQTTVVPEPSTIGLVALGLAGLVATRFRKKA